MKSDTIDLKDRLVLQMIRYESRKCAHGEIQPCWKNAYESLMNAADRLDAMEARTEIREGN